MEIFFLAIYAFIPVIVLIAIIRCIVEKYPTSVISVLLSIFCIFVGLWILIFIAYSNESKPANVYEQKVQAIQKAERELQKFLIDHPEFKEVSE
jgi:hypothetical protein